MPRARRHAEWAVAGALVLLGGALYVNARNNDFIFDDISIILTDPRVQNCQIGELLTGNYWYLPNTDRLYRPLVMASYGINWAISQEPAAFRLPNILIYAATCLVVFRLTRELFDSFWAGLIAGVFFAVHPIHTEPLNPIIGRADLAVTLLMLLAAWLYWRDGAPEARPNPGKVLLAAVCFAAAMLCKENAITLIGVVILLDWWRWQAGMLAGRQQWLSRRTVRCYLPMLLVVLAYLVARRLAVGALLSSTVVVDPWDNPIAHPTYQLAEGDSPFLARWATPLATFAKGVSLLVLPARLCYDYSYKAIDTVRHISDPRLWHGLAWLVVLTIGAAISYRRRRAVLLALGIALVTYSVVSNIPIVIGTIFGERLLYTPSVGFCMLVGVIGGACVRRVRSSALLTRAAYGVGLAVLAAAAGWFAWRTVDRNRDWRTNEAVARTAAKVNPESCKVLVGLADIALKEKRPEDALEHCRRAIQIVPGFWSPWRTAAVAYLRMGQPDKAFEYFKEALARGAGADPAAMLGASQLLADRGDYPRAIRLLKLLIEQRPGSATALNNLAWYLITAEPAELRDPVQALRYAREAMELQPQSAPESWRPWRTAAVAYLHMAQSDRAFEYFKEALARGAGADPAAMLAASQLLADRDDYAGAIRLLKLLIERRPGSAEALNNLAWYLIAAEPPELRDPVQALRYAREAMELQPQSGAIVDTHVAVLLALGQTEQAIACLQKALPRLQPDDPFLNTLRQRLEQLQQPR